MADAPRIQGARIVGTGDYCAPAGEQLPDLKPHVLSATGVAVRRVGRFIQLGLIGAGRAVAGAPLDPETGVYLSSGRGDMEVTIDVMTQMYVEGGPPRPLSFINTVSNSACFYIAKQFGLRGRSSFVCNRYFSFESALALALLDIELARAPAALVGTADLVAPPLRIHRERLRLPPDTPVAEGAHWLRLEASGAPGPRIRTMEFLPDREALTAWIREAAPRPERVRLAVGQFADAAVTTEIARACGVEHAFDYRSGLAYYDSQSGAAPGAFLRSDVDADTLLHINMDDRGAFAAFAVDR
jgi:hypothetical protein